MRYYIISLLVTNINNIISNVLIPRIPTYVLAYTCLLVDNIYNMRMHQMSERSELMLIHQQRERSERATHVI